MHAPRPNTYAAGVVDDGLTLLATQGRYDAAHFMHIHGIAFRVIVRVLAPGARVRPRRLPKAVHHIRAAHNC